MNSNLSMAVAQTHQQDLQRSANAALAAGLPARGPGLATRLARRISSAGHGRAVRRPVATPSRRAV